MSQEGNHSRVLHWALVRAASEQGGNSGQDAENPDASASTPPSAGPGARAAPLVAPHRGPLDRPAGEATIRELWSPSPSSPTERKFVSTAPQSQAAVSTKPDLTSATTSPGSRVWSSSWAARRTNPSAAPVVQRPGTASTPQEDGLCQRAVGGGLNLPLDRTSTPSPDASSKGSAPEYRRSSLSVPPGSKQPAPSNDDSRASNA